MKLTVLVEQQTYEVEVGDIHDRPIVTLVDGERIEVWPEDVQLIRPIPQATPTRSVMPAPTPAPISSPSSTSTSGAQTVLAPLPGVIVAINVKPGDVVEPGQELCVIEAMKMKNVIRATRAGTIGAVHIVLTQHVKHHDILLEYESNG